MSVHCFRYLRYKQCKKRKSIFMDLTFLCVNMTINMKSNRKLYSRLEVVNAMKSRFASGGCNFQQDNQS